jgi:SRSO17 transposase
MRCAARSCNTWGTRKRCWCSTKRAFRKGRHSAGVARPYNGTAATVDKDQIGVFLRYTSPLGHALVDRELSLPGEWTDDRERCQHAGMPADRHCATKPQLARVLAAGVPARWVTGDSV